MSETNINAYHTNVQEKREAVARAQAELDVAIKELQDKEAEFYPSEAPEPDLFDDEPEFDPKPKKEAKYK